MIQFVETDAEKIISNMVTQFENALGVTLQPSDERRIFLNQLAQFIVLLRAENNNTGNQVLLRYARDEALDEIGKMLGVERIPSRPAQCDLKFTVSVNTGVTIPKGTRATPDGNIYFATDSDLFIPNGSTEGVVKASSTVESAAHNGFGIGQIRYIVDNVPYLQSVENTSVSGGGADREDDESLRERIRLAPESFSTAGCVDGYKYWAKTAHTDVGDITVHSPSAGEVDIYFLKADGTLPDETEDKEIFDAVLASVSADDRRPLTDLVTVKAPKTQTYSIKFTCYVAKEDLDNFEQIKTNIQDAVEKYKSWQREKIGRDINPDRLRSVLYVAGASRIEMTSPTYKKLDDTTVASLSGEPSITISQDSE